MRVGTAPERVGVGVVQNLAGETKAGGRALRGRRADGFEGQTDERGQQGGGQGDGTEDRQGILPGLAGSRPGRLEVALGGTQESLEGQADGSRINLQRILQISGVKSEQDWGVTAVPASAEFGVIACQSEVSEASVIGQSEAEMLGVGRYSEAMSLNLPPAAKTSAVQKNHNASVEQGRREEERGQNTGVH